jgi:hypothetical protein
MEKTAGNIPAAKFQTRKENEKKKEGANITHTNLCLCCGRPFSPNVQSRPFSNKWKPIFLPFEKYDVYSYTRKAPGKHTVHSIDIDPPGKFVQNPINLIICFSLIFLASLMRNPPSGFFFEWGHNKTRKCRPTQKNDDYKDGGCCCRSYTIAGEVFWAINEQGNDGYVCE